MFTCPPFFQLKVSAMLPLPPPPPGLPPKSAGNPSEGSTENEVSNPSDNKDGANLVPPPPPPPRQQQPVPRPGMMPTMQPDVLPPGMSRFRPPPPPPDMRPPLSAAGLPNQGVPPGMMVPLLPRPPYGPPPGAPPMMRPPLPPGPPPTLLEDDLAAIRPPVPPKPSYVKSAAPTVVKRPLAQHTPELTAMVSPFSSAHCCRCIFISRLLCHIHCLVV